jgi:hypothetical protein
MQVVHAQDMPWAERQERHREGSLAFKNLFHGQEGDPNNFRLVLSRNSGEYKSPLHRHNFDQVRFCVRGAASIAPGKSLEEGDVGYFPEGTFYGPQDDKGGDRVTLVFQGGGASGLGYMSAAQLKRGTEELERQGVFSGGRFMRTGETETRDSYEAIWEHVMGRPIIYPDGRYEDPVLVRTGAFSWRSDAPGVSKKALGSFTERGVRLESLRMDVGAETTLSAPGAMALVFVVAGQGALAAPGLAGEAGIYKEWTALHLAKDDSVGLRASAPTELLVMTFPWINRS